MKVFRSPESPLATAGVGLTLIIAVIYYLQLITMGNSVDTSRKVSEREARALVDFTQISPLQVSPGNVITLPARVTNIGKTQARSVVVLSAVEILPRAEAPHFDEILPGFRHEVGDVFPADHIDFDIWSQQGKGGVQRGGETENRILKDTEYADLLNGNTYIAIHGRINYVDIFKVAHWTDFCYWKPLSTKAGEFNASTCVMGGNTEDDNDEP